MPESVRAIIIREAETSNHTISATQNIPVFFTSPREKKRAHEEPDAVEPTLAADTTAFTTPHGLTYQPGDEVEWNTGNSEPLRFRIDSVSDENVQITFLDKDHLESAPWRISTSGLTFCFQSLPA